MLTESSYTVRLQFARPVGGADFYADYFTMQSIVSTEEHSWGSIKEMYR